MKRSLLLDADVVIDLYTLDLIRKMARSYDLKATSEVLREAKFFRRGEERITIDLGERLTQAPTFEGEILDHWHSGHSIRAMALSLRVARPMVGKYVAITRFHGYEALGHLLLLPNPLDIRFVERLFHGIAQPGRIETCGR